MKSVMLLLGAIVVILLMPAVMPSIQDFRSTDYTEAHGSVATAAAATTANVTLTQDLFLDDTAQVASVTSNLTTDVPLVSTYTTATNYLYITGLTADSTRTLTVIYDIGDLDNYYGADLGARVWPLFLILGVIGVIVAAVYSGSRRD